MPLSFIDPLHTMQSHRVVIAEGGVMNKDIAAGNFKQMKGKIKEQWGKLTDDEIDQIEGSTDVLAGKLQERYGWEREEAERQVKDFSRRHGWQ
jgi:uncharacterized protein YjbJ (UPF0337 family)